MAQSGPNSGGDLSDMAAKGTSIPKDSAKQAAGGLPNVGGDDRKRDTKEDLVDQGTSGGDLKGSEGKAKAEVDSTAAANNLI